MEILKFTAENPASATALLLGLVVAVFYLGSTYATMLSVRNRMDELVTAKDLHLELARFREELDKRYVGRDDCTNRHTFPSVSLIEHGVLMARVTNLEKERQK